MNPWRSIFHPSLVAKRWIRKQQDWSLQTKLDLDWFPRPHYAYGLNQASIQAKRLGLERITAIEFGIADGDGLVAIETIVADLVKEHRVAIDVYGFDATLPPSADRRDLPYAHRRSVGPAERSAVESRLTSARLVVGDVRETVPDFLAAAAGVAPIGFVSLALGDYTSTVGALGLFDAPHATRLPRAFCYVDDVVGTDDELHCEYVGELLAIAEFNARHERLKLGRINGLAHKRIFRGPWCEQLYVLHDFAHPRYGDYTGPDAGRQAPVKE